MKIFFSRFIYTIYIKKIKQLVNKQKMVHSDCLVIQQLKGGGPSTADRLINKIGVNEEKSAIQIEQCTFCIGAKYLLMFNLCF